jgi:hypothetical protein
MHPPRLMSPTATHPVAARHAGVKRPTPADAPAPQTTTSAPRATVASVASHSSGGAGLATAPRHTAAKTHAQTAHAKPSVPTRHSTSVSRATSTPVSSNSYVNPLAHASLTPERIDQGVDYSGSGTLTALGAGRVTYVGTSGTGWPGAFIEYRLTSGADSGRYVFYAEHVSPLVRVGQTLRPGQSVATIGGGIEIGWGSGVGTQPLAQAEGQWSHTSDAENYASPAGRSFSALIASLGGPPGKVEG